MKRVTGIGGIFFKCKELEKIKQWYKAHLSFDTDEYGAKFEWSQGRTRQIKDILYGALFRIRPYILPSSKDFMINYQVENIESLVEELKKEGVRVLDKVETNDYGKFVHVLTSKATKLNYGNLLTKSSC